MFKKEVKVSSYIVQNPVLRTAQNAQTLLWEASSLLQLMHEGCSYKYQPLSIARYSFKQLSELEQCRVKKLAQGFNTAAQDLNVGSLSRESRDLPLSHCFLNAFVCVWVTWSYLPQRNQTVTDRGRAGWSSCETVLRCWWRCRCNCLCPPPGPLWSSVAVLAAACDGGCLPQ